MQNKSGNGRSGAERLNIASTAPFVMYGPVRRVCQSLNCGSSLENFASLKHLPLVKIHAIDDAGLVAVLQILADAR